MKIIHYGFTKKESFELLKFNYPFRPDLIFR